MIKEVWRTEHIITDRVIKRVWKAGHVIDQFCLGKNKLNGEMFASQQMCGNKQTYIIQTNITYVQLALWYKKASMKFCRKGLFLQKKLFIGHQSETQYSDLQQFMTQLKSAM